MFSSKYASLITLVIGLVVGFYLTRLFSPSPPAPVTVLQPEITKAKVVVVTATYQAAFDSLHKANTTLTTSLANTKTELATTKVQSAGLQKQVLSLIDNGPAAATTGQPAEDSCACDTLRKTVGAFVAANDRKDSLYESALSSSDSLLTIKAAALQITVRQKDFLSAQLDTTLSKQSDLIREDLYYQEQYHKQKKKTWIASGASALLAAIGILLVHH